VLPDSEDAGAGAAGAPSSLPAARVVDTDCEVTVLRVDPSRLPVDGTGLGLDGLTGSVLDASEEEILRARLQFSLRVHTATETLLDRAPVRARFVAREC
jgi:hypothetical protein